MIINEKVVPPIPPFPPNKTFKEGWFGGVGSETKESIERRRLWEESLKTGSWKKNEKNT